MAYIYLFGTTWRLAIINKTKLQNQKLIRISPYNELVQGVTNLYLQTLLRRNIQYKKNIPDIIILTFY